MREFVFGKKADFDALERMLADGQCHVYNNCVLPDCCQPKKARIGFEKTNDVYVLYIDKGITTTANNVNFRYLLENGETKFLCIEDMKTFLGSLQPLFRIEEKSNVKNDSSKAVAEHINKEKNDAGDVVDKQKLKELREEEIKPKMVWPEEIAQPLKKKVFGQDNVINTIADKIVINRMRKDKRLLTMALIGPTATGKSETAKSLADVLSSVYGTPFGFIEIAGSEFIGEHTVHRFFGAPPGYVGHGEPTVLENVRNNPNHVVVINEVEKADEKLLTGLMEAIDTGFLGMADNSKPIDLNSCIMMFTSNLPVDMEEYSQKSDFEKSEMCRDAFTKHCGRPEISGKIGNFVVYNPLSDEAKVDIVVKFVRDELKSYDLKLVKIDEYLMSDFLKHQTRYGARGIRGLVSDSLGTHLLRDHKLDLLRNKEVTLKGTIEKIEFEIN